MVVYGGVWFYPLISNYLYLLGSMALTTIAVTATAVLCGALVGAIFGFSIASHDDVMAGFRRSKANRFVRWLSRPTREFTGLDALLAVFVMVLWLLAFVLLCGAPFVLAAKLGGERPQLMGIALAALAIASWFGRVIGRNVWARVL